MIRGEKMEILIKKPAQVILSNRLSHHNYYGWPTIARLKNGRLALAFSGFRIDHVCPFGKACISFSENEGGSFSLPAPVIDTVLDDRDTGLCPFGESGLIVTSFNNTREMQRDHAGDNAYRLSYLDTITDEEEAFVIGSTFRISTDNGITFGRLHRSPVTSPHGSLELKDGTILWVGRTFSDDDSVMSDDHVACYEMNTVTGEMTKRGRVDDIFTADGEKYLSCEPHAIELPDGSLLCHIRVERGGEYKKFTTYQTISADKGYTWSRPVQILGDSGGAPAHIIRHSSGAVISVYGYRQKPYGIRAAISTDDGATFETDKILWADGVSWDLGYPATVELTDGSLFTVFYAHENAAAPAEIFAVNWELK